MAIESSSTRSAIAAPAASAPAPDDASEQDRIEEEEVEDRPVKERPAAGSLKQALIDQIDDCNLARYIEQSELDRIGVLCHREYEIDDQSRTEWVEAAEKAMKLAKMVTEQKQYPWPGASNVIIPLMAYAALGFNARAYGAIIRGRKVVKGATWGPDRGLPVTDTGEPDGTPKQVMGKNGQMGPAWIIEPGAKRKKADKIGEFVSWQLLDEMIEWEPQLDQKLMEMPITGGFARKTYWDPPCERPASPAVGLANLVWNYHAPSFETAPRHSEKVMKYPSEITELEREGDEGEGGAFLEIVYGTGAGGAEGESYGFDKEVQSGSTEDDDAPQMFIEQHRRLDLDDDDYAEPYTVTFHLGTRKVVRIVARYDEDGIKASDDDDTILRIEPDEIYTLFPFLPSMDGSSHPTGFGHLLSHLIHALNSSVNQMLDAGHLQNAGGGFISNRLGAPSGQINFQVGSFKRVDSGGQNIRDAVFPIPFPGPSPVLKELFGLLLAMAKEVASIQEILAGDARLASASPTTILALIEQGMTLYTSIHKRIYRSLKREVNKIWKLDQRYIKEPKEYPIGDEVFQMKPEDFKTKGGVEPVTDPTMLTDMQMLGRAEALMVIKDDPLVNRQEVLTRYCEAMRVDHIDDLFVPPDPTIAQMAMAKAQAELGRERAAELKDQTQAFLNMALAKKNSTAGQEAWIEAQLDFLRLHIEALNTQVQAAGVDAKMHGIHMDAVQQEAERAARTAEAGAQGAPPPPTAEPAPGPPGPFPVPPNAPIAPAAGGATPPPGGPSDTTGLSTITNPAKMGSLLGMGGGAQPPVAAPKTPALVG